MASPDSAPDFGRVRRVFEAVADLPPGERERRLAAECAGDRALEEAVLAMLQGDAIAREGRLFEGVHDEGVFADPDDPLGLGREGAAPVEVGGFRVLRRLASGGMGVVYLAEQESPRRAVALKVLKPAFCAGAALRRFQVESEILARMRHPAIAEVYAAGVQAFRAGPVRLDVPWYAMEYLEGARTIAAHATQRALAVEERLRLFAAVCAGVHHAHGMGVIHRDLKPANVLVDGEGRVKIIDFGIARAVSPGDELATLRTLPGELVGTLRYMAPEQLDADPSRIDVRTDVYALGVILYELLAGCPPFDLGGRSLTEAARILRETEPARPSEVDPALAGELEWIVLRALEKDPARRYASADQLREDVLRHLADEPLLAAPAGWLYRFRKRLRRHRVAAALSSVLLLALVAWSLTSHLARRRAEAAERLAEQRRLFAERAYLKSDRMVSFALTLIDGLGASKEPATVAIESALDHACALVGKLFAEDPDVEAELHDMLATILSRRSRFADAERQLRAGLALLERAGLGDTQQAGRMRANLATALRANGDLAGSREATGGAPGDAAPGIAEGETLEAAYARAAQDLSEGRFARAEPLMRLVAEQAVATRGDTCTTAVMRNGLAIALRELGRLDEAEAIAQDVLERDRGLHGEHHLHTLTTEYNLAALRTSQQRYAEAIAICEAMLPRQIEVLGPTHGRTFLVQGLIASARLELGDAEAAERIFRETLAAQLAEAGRGHPDTIRTARGLAECLLRTGRAAEAEALLSDLREATRDRLPEGNVNAALMLADHGRCLAALGREAEGERELAEGYAGVALVFGAEHERARALRRMLDELRAGGRAEDAASDR